MIWTNVLGLLTITPIWFSQFPNFDLEWDVIKVPVGVIWRCLNTLVYIEYLWRLTPHCPSTCSRLRSIKLTTQVCIQATRGSEPLAFRSRSGHAWGVGGGGFKPSFGRVLAKCTSDGGAVFHVCIQVTPANAVLKNIWPVSNLAPHKLPKN